MLPRETSVRQLKMLRKLTKGTDIGDLTVDDRLNHNTPNLQYIGNPIDTGVDSYEDFTEKDNKLQTIAFKSKLVNKPLVKENKKENMEKKLNNMLSISDFEKNLKPDEDILKEYHNPNYHPEPKVGEDPAWLEIYKLNKLHKKRYAEEPEYKKKYDKDLTAKEKSEKEMEEINKKRAEYKEEDAEDKIQNFGTFVFDDDDDDDEEEEIRRRRRSITESKKEKKEPKEPKYEFLGKEKEPKSNPNFGYAAVRDQEIKKIGSFTNYTKLIDPKTPKERPILNAGVFIDNDKVKGYVNRIEGKDVYVESLDEPMVIKKFTLKDAVKIKKEDK